ncbi:MAG TPA: aldo/keto reductase [Ignavibacteriaceae bacterium]|nr:aldo/keto reductase [Ignavibacterium sp.]HMN17871.1 aldo/keto reductase [Ignavibacteriaceae bacterium]
MATVEGTKKYISEYPEIKSKVLGKTGFTVSICGFGGYRIDYGVSQHKNALELALTSGINLVDTSSNYSDGGSETLVGKVINKLVSENKIDTENIVVVSKGGYIQGANLKLAVEREQSGKPFTEVVKCGQDLWHCISPDFLENQITLSLQRLNLKTIDVYLLHNPEYFLTYSIISDSDRREREFYRRIKSAFIHLEKEVDNGRIAYYGISSNTFAERQSKQNFVSLERIIETANEISDRNHFAVVQFPMNLIESGGMNILNQQNQTRTFLDTAAENNLGVLVNRPLNAINKNKLIRLADYPVTEDRNEKEIFYLIDDLNKQENLIIEKYINFIGLSTSEKKNLIDCISVSNILKTNYKKFDDPGRFREIKTTYLIPRANFAINEIGKNYSNDENILRTLRNYAVTTNILLDSIFSNLAKDKNKENLIFHKVIDKFANIEQQKLSLSQKAILLINSVPQVTITLVGMKSINYVEDVKKSIKSEYVEKYSDYWHNNGSII